ncbi:MAG: hypothetical protein HXS40_08300 [Theionarchaea archaeon]|nr:hypothetical protein [Theionarchaea archaeon]
MIEPRLNVDGGVNPDILFMSETRGLFAECKGATFYVGANLEKYDQVTLRHLVEKGIDVPTEFLELDVGIFGKENLELLKERLESQGIDYPQVTLNCVIQKKHGRDFKDPRLQSLFLKPVEIRGRPLNVLRFAPDSSLKRLAPYVFQTLISRIISGNTEFTTRELAGETLGEIGERLDSQLMKALGNKMGEFLRICRKTYLRKYLSKDGKTWRIGVNDHWKSRNRFRQDCQKVVEDLDQTTLFDFGVRKDKG